MGIIINIHKIRLTGIQPKILQVAKIYLDKKDILQTLQLNLKIILYKIYQIMMFGLVQAMIMLKLIMLLDISYIRTNLQQREIGIGLMAPKKGHIFLKATHY